MTLVSGTITPELSLAADRLLRDYLAIRPQEAVLITLDSASDPLAAQAVFNAAHTIGASPALLAIPQLPFQGSLADPYVSRTLAAAVKSCDLWIDLTFPYLAGSHAYDQALEGGELRYFLGGDLGSGGLLRIFGRVDLDRHYAVQQAFDQLIARSLGKTVRVTNARGSDVTFVLAKQGFTRPRRATNSGMYLVPGSCTMFPELESVRGVILVDSLFHEYYTPLPSPLGLQVDGKIRAIEGGGPERRVMDRALRRAGGGEYGYVIHFSHGIHPAARITGRSFVEDMRVIGNSAIGFGLPFWVPGGGENHPDGVLAQQSFTIDGTPVVEDGAFVLPELARLAEDLKPTYF